MTDINHKIRQIAEQHSSWSVLPRSCYELSITLFLYIATLITLVYSSSYFTSGVAIVVLSLCIVRLFIIQHDCGHRSLFKDAKTNDAIGRLLSLLTITPYHFWRKTHNYHHGHSGIEGKMIGAIEILTVRVYRQLAPFKKLAYIVYRSSYFLLGLAPILLFAVAYRSPAMLKKVSDVSPTLGKRDWHGFYCLNVAILIFYGSLMYFLGIEFILKLCLSLYLASIIGIILFYIQHNYKKTYVTKKEAWSNWDASIKGASLFLPPPIINWFIGNIGYHYLHHLYPMIPFYRLKKIHREISIYLNSITVVRLVDIPSLFRLKLYDTHEMITWKEYKKKYVKKTH